MTHRLRVRTGWSWAAGFAALISLATQALAQPMQASGPAATLAESCMSCHGIAGKGQGAIPQLAGKPQEAIQAAMTEFASGARPGTIMRIIAKGYTADQAAALGAYFAQVR